MKYKILLGTLVVLVALATVPSAMAANTFYLVPQHSQGTLGGSTIVELWLDYDTKIGGYQVDLGFDNTIVNISQVDVCVGLGSAGYHSDYVTIPVAFIPALTGPDSVRLANLTLDSKGVYGVSNLNFSNTKLSDDSFPSQPLLHNATNGTYTVSPPPEPDLVVTKIDPKTKIFVNATNVFTVYVKNQGTAEVTGSFDVSWQITDDALNVLTNGTETITDLAIGEEKSFDFNWKPTVLQNTTVSATSDSGDAVIESDETNNTLSVKYVQDDDSESGTGILPLSKWGYGGDEPFTNYKTDEVAGDLIYSFGDSAYLSGWNNPWSTYTVNFNLGTDVNQISGNPEGVGSGTVKEARLYMYYGWYRTPLGWPLDPEQKLSLTFEGNPISTDAKYEDSPGFGKYGDFKFGTFAYNVTSYIIEDGTYQAVLSNDNITGGTPDTLATAIYGMALLVIYEDSSKSLKEYHIAEGFDSLKQYYYKNNRYNYHVIPEDATSTVNMPAVTGDITRLFTVTHDAGSSPDKSRLYFNTGQWSDPWTYIFSYTGTNIEDVSSLKANPNTVAFQDRGDGYQASNVILISSSGEPDLVVTKIDPKTKIFVDATNVFTVYVKNQGTAEVTGSFDVSWQITDDALNVLTNGTETITDLAIGEEKSFDFNWKPTVLQNTTVSATSDSGDAVIESDETNNTLSVKYVQDDDSESGTGILPLSKWGYGGDEPFTNYKTDEVAGDLIYSFGDSAYLSGWNNPWSTYTVNFNLGTDVNQISGNPEGVGSGTVKEARLYMYYGWYRTPLGWPLDPEQKLSLTFEGNPISTDAKYEDSPGFGKYGDFKFGTFAYNVTSYIIEDGTYQAVLSNDNITGGTPDTLATAIYGMALLVIYEDSSKSLKEYHIAEGFDSLKQYYYKNNRYNYHVIPEDATSTVNMPAVTGDITRLFTVTHDAGSSPDKSRLYFNTGQWSDPWTYIFSYTGTNIEDVSSLKANPNTVAFQDRGDGYQVSNAILISNNATIDLGPHQDTEVGRHIMVPITANELKQFYGTVEMNLSYEASKFDFVAVHSSSDSIVTAYQDYPTLGILDISAWNQGGVKGDVVLATVELEVIAGAGSDPELSLTVGVFEDIYGKTMEKYTVPTTISIKDPTNKLSITSATSDPQSDLGDDNFGILNDNGRLRHTGDNETVISAVVTDAGLGIDSVTVDLSAIGGSANTLMSGPYPNSGTYSVTTTATAGIDGIHTFVVTAKDNGGNTATDTTNELTVYRRGDVKQNNKVDMGDALYIARYTVGLESPVMDHFDFVGDVQPASDGDHTTNMGDALFIARHTVGLEPAP